VEALAYRSALSLAVLLFWAIFWAVGYASAPVENIALMELRDEAPRIEVRATPANCGRIPCRVEFRAFLHGVLQGSAWNCPETRWEWGDDASPSTSLPSDPCGYTEPERVYPLLGDMVGGAITDYKAHTFIDPGNHRIWFRMFSTGRRRELVSGFVDVNVPKGL
jgi:hypothetical protein